MTALRKKIIYFNYMNDLYGSSLGSTLKALKLIGGLRELGWQVTMCWRREGYKEPSQRPAVPPSRWRRWARILFFTPKEILKNVVDFFIELRLVRRERPQLIISRLDAFRLSALFVARAEKIPLVVEADGASSYEWLHYHGGPHIRPSALL